MSRDTSTRGVLGELTRLFGRGTVTGLGGGELLRRFVADGDEAAFAALLALHGPMVLGVCRRALRDRDDVEDAFQATFLVLARRAGTLRDGDRVGPWLYGVARRVSARARAVAVRRGVREPVIDDAVRSAPDPTSADPGRRELLEIVDAELARLPDALRAPLVLCYLDGLTHEEAARRLGCPVGTVRSRMARGRDRLRRRLSRRGLDAGDASLATALASPAVPPSLLGATARAALTFSTGKSSAALAAATTTAAALAQGVLNAMFFAKLKTLGAVALTCVLTIWGARTYAFQFGGMGIGPAHTRGKAVSKPENRQAALRRSIDEIQARLDESVVRNNELQKQVDALRAQLEALRSARSPTGDKETRTEKEAETKGAQLVEDAEPKPDIPAAPQHWRLGRFPDSPFLVVSPAGDKATVYFPVTKQAKSSRLSEDKRTPHKVTMISGNGIVAFGIQGPRITRLAAFNEADATWYPVDLREPVDEATPSVGLGSVTYRLGNRIYDFSAAAKRWDVLEFPAGVTPIKNGPYVPYTYEQDGHIYIYNSKTGKWDDLDTRAILEIPDSEGTAKPGPR